MEQKFVTIAILVCGLVAFVHSAPQLRNRSSRPAANGFQNQPQQQYQQFQAQPQAHHAPAPQARAPARLQSSGEDSRESRFLVVQDDFHQEPNGEYNFEQVFKNGETYNEQGLLKRVTNPEDGKERDVIVTKGSYTIIDNDGSTVLVNYTADENGFHPEIVTNAPHGRK